MSFLDDLNRLANPLKKLVLTGPAHRMFSDKSAAVSFTCQQTGSTLTIAADYIRSDRVVYLMIDHHESCWKNLESGCPVKLWLDGKSYSGWAEGLTGYDEFLKILSLNPTTRQQLIQRYASLEEEADFENIQNLKDFLADYRLIRAKISR